MTVVALSRFEDERAPIPDIERIVRIRRPNRAVLVRGGVGSLRARREVPVGHRMLVVVRHDPDGQPLRVTASLGQRVVDDRPAIHSTLGFELRPEPAHIGDARRRKIGVRCRRRIDAGGLRTHFGPADTLVQGLSLESLERLDPHARIHEHVVYLGGTNNRRLGRHYGRGHQEPEYRSNDRGRTSKRLMLHDSLLSSHEAIHSRALCAASLRTSAKAASAGVFA